jgi:DNA repair protein RAD16
MQIANWRSSTKIEALMEELTRTKEKYPNRKSLVFSQFVNFLDLIEWRLILGGFKCVKLDGRMNAIQKDLAIHKFNNDPDVTVFLISLKAGGIALNLTVASHCYLLDPWWNPAAEFQAIDRIYRYFIVMPLFSFLLNGLKCVLDWDNINAYRLFDL